MESRDRRREMEAEMLEDVSEAVAAIKKAKHVDQVICALHSLAVLVFPVDSSLLSGVVDEGYRDQILGMNLPSANEREDRWQTFYRGAAFPSLARVLLYDVASDWLACFPFTAQKHVYDVFFVDGLATEVVQTLVPRLHQNSIAGLDVNAIVSNVQRLIVLFLLESTGVLRIATEFARSQREGSSHEQLQPVISRVAQLIASVPDKAQFRALSSLSAHIFFRQIITQLFCGFDGRDLTTDPGRTLNKSEMDGTFHFTGEIFARICRRGFTDVLAGEVVPRMLSHIRGLLLSKGTTIAADVFESDPGSQFWIKMMGNIKDSYAVERTSEELLRGLATEHINDTEAYWVIWILFHNLFYNQESVRTLFLDKFLLWKVLPVQCLRWIFQFAVFGCPPNPDSQVSNHVSQQLPVTLQSLVVVWSKQEFLRSASLEQQVYVTAAVGLLLEQMSKEELDKSKDVMRSILQGVSCRLESPDHLIRKMASSIALAFSKVIDPKNPLYLDDSFSGESIDWEFGLGTSKYSALPTSNSQTKGIHETKTSVGTVDMTEFNDIATDGQEGDLKNERKKLSEYKMIDPDEIIDPASLELERGSDFENMSESSDASNDTSLEPYDLTDDQTDLKRRFSQLVDVVTALRKTDDVDGVEQALEVAERLVRASPDELKYVASDLVRSLIQIRCSDVAVEGEEDSAEEKRQRALVALVVASPLESLETAHKLLYSPNVDVSQRIMILDIMTEAAEELAKAKIMRLKHQTGPLVSITSESRPWFMPSSAGPAGAGSWKEVAGSGTVLNLSSTGTDNVPNWSTHYERELPPKPGQMKRGKTRRWSIKSTNMREDQIDISQNKFPVYAAAFMLPAMQGFDKKRHGVDLLGRDYIVLGKLIYFLGVCMKCTCMHPEATALAPPLLDLLGSRQCRNF
ncbi:telomere length regulation protein TEL2 homolog isoform X2 [Rhodamnia argentea]|uniref:Telomere length regulation protein TEL2 homolog isoform X2 n=1 Tax=Rhodamnia argentea TaxID=178133 RepID=A0ABM3HLQ5_9MYRT|nr:telomere length regulation protein TEL2 homolog isoform X2 [Rhodamnia argentea]